MRDGAPIGPGGPAVACAPLAAVLALVALMLVAPTASNADVFETIRLASVSTAGLAQQADYARDPAISGNGEYIAFDGEFDGENGVWRRDLASGAVEKVVGGDARLPSISEEGRYISFTTTERLVPEDSNEGPDVYVRDMDVPAEAPGAYTLVSAITVAGATQGLRYEYATSSGTPAREQEEKQVGALALGRSAISANGRKVAFVTTAASDLAGPGTPAMQVAVRNLETGETQLVSALADPATGAPELNAEGQDMPVPTTGENGSVVGAIYPEKAKTRFEPVTGETNASTFGDIWVGASISADGSTVAWLGQQVGRQTKVLAHDAAASEPEYTEPLWRRIDEGPTAPIRRVTGGTDPASPACEASGEQSVSQPPSLSDPCQGPFEPRLPESGEAGIWAGASEGPDYQPHLSANGNLVAFLSDARYLPTGNEFNGLGDSDDLYVTNMQSGLTRTLALTRLTALAGGNVAETARAAPISDIGISPDGTQVAFSTKRTAFPLSLPAYVSAPAGIAGMAELYDVDLANETLTRVTHGFGGEDEPAEEPHEEVTGEDPYKGDEQGSFSPSFSDDGDVLAFSSSADNLVFGDGNDAVDAFVVDRKVFPTETIQQYVSSAPPGPSLIPSWLLGISALAHANGSVTLYAQVPGAGQLRASARGSVLVSSPARHGHKRSTHAALETVASAARSATGAGALQSLTLSPPARYLAMAERRGGLSATVTATFSAPGHATLRQSILITFHRTIKASKPTRKKARRGKARRKGHGG
jgi:hypothetical protein